MFKWAWLNGVCFYACWATFTLGMGMLCLPALLSTRATWRVADAWCDATLWLLKKTCAITVRYMPLLAANVKLYAANHESTLDTLLLWRALHHPAFVLKRELCWIPVFGWYLWRCKPIAIRRGSARALDSIIEAARVRIREGRTIIIFPQGTRSAPVKRTPFKRGIAILSYKLSEAVQPIALQTHGVWPKGKIRKFRGEARADALETMPDCSTDLQGWLHDLQQRITSANGDGA